VGGGVKKFSARFTRRICPPLSKPWRRPCAPRFVWRRDTPDFRHAFSNYINFQPCSRI